jgi:cell wall-associated NlpC family hydrolase
MNIDTQISKAADRFVDCPYVLGDIRKGFDCLSMVLDFYRAMGIDLLPGEWNGWTEENYPERWERGEGRREFIDWLKTLGVSVDLAYLQRGDLIIFDGPIPSGEFKGPGIYLGNGHVVRIFQNGGHVIPLKPFEHTIVDVRRLI